MTNPLAKSAHERSVRSRESVLSALRVLERSAVPISIRAVAAKAKVSRNYIYSTPECLDAVRAAASRQERKVAASPLARPTDRSSDASLRTRLAAALTENEDLRVRITELEAANAALVEKVVDLQNPQPVNVSDIRRRRG